MIRVLVALMASLVSSLALAQSTARVNVLSYSSTNVTTTAYTQLVASSPTSSSRFEICDTSSHLLKIATGAAGAEVDVMTVAPSGCIIVPFYQAPGTRLSIKAIDASATTGYNVLSFLP